MAELACKIEIDVLGNPIGKQDQYAVAFGGFRKYFFNKDDSVTVKEMDMDDSDLEKFNDNILLVNTEITRKSSDILMDQKVHMDINAEHLHTIKAIAEKSEEYFKSSNYGELGNLLNISWNNKKILANKISNCKIDEIYENGKKAGVFGGKLLGAGGGGFFMFLCSPDRQEKLKTILAENKILPVKFAKYGSRIVFNSINE